MAAAVPATMKVAIIDAKGAPPNYKDAKVAPLGKYDVLVQVEACGLCHSDVLGQNMSASYPRILGHEVIGTVVALGTEAKRWKVGDRVGRGWHGGHCFECRSCQKGDFISCKNRQATGWQMDGGYCEYMVSPWEALAGVPQGLLPADAAPLMCAGLTVYNSMRHQNKTAGGLVAVQGIGGLGHYAIQFASKMGYEVAAITSIDKTALARELGARHVIDGKSGNPADALMKMGGANLVVCTGLGAKSMSPLAGGLATDGTLLILGADHENLAISPLTLIGNRGAVRGWPSGAPQDAQETMEFASKFGIKSYVETFPLEKAKEAFNHMLSGKARFRVVLLTAAGEKATAAITAANAAAAAAAKK